jgi:cytoskeletal protein RodZ
MAMMKKLEFNERWILTFSLLIFLLTVGAEAVFIWLLLRQKSEAQSAADALRLKEQATKELGTPQARSLREPLPSVTEHTTRSFEPVYREQKSK